MSSPASRLAELQALGDVPIGSVLVDNDGVSLAALWRVKPDRSLLCIYSHTATNIGQIFRIEPDAFFRFITIESVLS